MVKGKLKIIWDDEAKVALRSIYDYIKYRESVGVYEVTLEYILVLDIFHTSRDPSGIN